MSDQLASYIRTHRKRAALSQQELAMILGYDNKIAVSRHERFHTLPPLMIALGYEVVFRIPISELFAGLHGSVDQAVEERLAEFQRNLENQSGRGRQAAVVARKLEWLYTRRDSEH